MKLFEGKKGIVMGVANNHSIASGVAKFLYEQGAELGFSHLPDDTGKMEGRVRKVVDELNPKLLIPCDVNSDEDVKNFFETVKETMGEIDFLVHSIAFAPMEDIRCPTLESSREGFRIALDTSCYSFICTAREASKIMKEGGSMVTMSYFGGEKVCAGYNMMGIAKAALECAVKYLAFDLGPKQIRVNSISAGPIKTLAASAVGDFKQMLGLNAGIAPLGRNVTPEEVGKTAGYLLSDMASATTGENIHVDCGYSIMGNMGYAFDRWDLDPSVTKNAVK